MRETGKVRIRVQPRSRVEANRGRELVKVSLQKIAPFSSMLDIGAGLGEELMAAKRICPGARLHAIEICDVYAEKLKESGVNVCVASIEKERFPFSDCNIDVVIANHVLEHTKDIFWIFHEVTRILSIGGHLIIGVPNLASLHNRFLLAIGRQPTSIRTSGPHVRGFTRADIFDFISSVFPNGYEVIGFGGSNFYPLPPTLAKLAAKMAPGMAVSIGLLLIKTRAYSGEFIEYPVEAGLETNFYLGDGN